MRKNDSLELKIIRVVMPLLIYYGILLLVQSMFGFYAIAEEFLSIEDSDTAGYILAYNFLNNTDEYIKSHSLITNFIAAVIAVIILRVIMKKEFGDTVFDNYKQIGWREALILGFMGIFIASGVGRLVNLFPLDNIIGSYSEVSKEFISNPIPFQILTLCIVSPIAEEVIFRGIMYRRLSEYSDIMTAVIISAIVFGVYHGNLVQGIYALLLGIMLCYVYDSCHTLAAPIFLHMICNAAALIIMYFPVSRYISNNIILNIIIMLLEIFGMVYFTYRLYKLKNKEMEEERK